MPIPRGSPHPLPSQFLYFISPFSTHHSTLRFMASASAMDSRSRAEEALRLAEDKFLRGDPVRARIHAAKAQSLCPSLPGVAAALTAYRVHAAAASSRLPDGSVDYYAVLDVRPADGLDAAKKQFKRMCLLTHPDKNKCAAAESAFRLVVKAWDVIHSWSAGVRAQQRTAPPPGHQSETSKPSTRPPSDRPSEASKPPTRPPRDHPSGTARPRAQAPPRSSYAAEVRFRVERRRETSKPPTRPPSDHPSGTARPRAQAPRRSSYAAEVRFRVEEVGAGASISFSVQMQEGLQAPFGIN